MLRLFLQNLNEEITENDIEKIYDLSEEESISTIYIRCDSTEREELSIAIDSIDATDISAKPSTSGAGIVIGILDAGIVDENNSELKKEDLTVRTEWWYDEDVSDHATQVAMCALAVAPNASILSVEKCGEPSSEIEWLLDNGVNVINISLAVGSESGFGYYTSQSAYCDYIARNNWVVFTCSAGNRGKNDALVTPINGYNNITVGACYKSGNLSPISSYKENFAINFPNIVAPGELLTFPTFSGNYSGTSYSAPLTAGAVAVLMQDSPSLINYPEKVLAIIMASTERIIGHAVKSGFDDKVGTGMLNVANALKTADFSYSFTNATDKVGSYVSYKTVYLRAGQKIRIAFVSLVNNKSDSDVSTNLVTDYDLYLFDSNGNSKASSLTLYNNEFIDYTVTVTGQYTIKIKQYSAKKTSMTDYCAFAYYIE